MFIQRKQDMKMGSYPEKNCFNFPTVFSHLFVNNWVEDVFGGNAGVRYAFVVANHPYEHIRDAVLGLTGKQTRKRWVLSRSMWME